MDKKNIETVNAHVNLLWTWSEERIDWTLFFVLKILYDKYNLLKFTFEKLELKTNKLFLKCVFCNTIYFVNFSIATLESFNNSEK